MKIESTEPLPEKQKQQEPKPRNQNEAPQRRRIVQIVSANGVLAALANDGTVWLLVQAERWQGVAELPQPTQ